MWASNQARILHRQEHAVQLAEAIFATLALALSVESISGVKGESEWWRRGKDDASLTA